jgi:two-component system LytT family response regulator
MNVLIIDDEPNCISLLQIQLKKYCPEINTIITFTSPLQALEEIELLKPDLLFLDIDMPEMNGFEFLEKIFPVNFNVIFITAYNQFALKAFRVNALDYLVKPIDNSELKEAVAKAENKRIPIANQLNNMQRQLRGEKVNKIAISTHNGISFIELSDILFAEANNNYTKLVLTNGNSFTISKLLKEIQSVLEESHFFRVHRQFIINLNYVKHFNRNDFVVTMNNKIEIPVARNQKDEFIEKFSRL